MTKKSSLPVVCPQMPGAVLDPFFGLGDGPDEVEFYSDVDLDSVSDIRALVDTYVREPYAAWGPLSRQLLARSASSCSAMRRTIWSVRR